jgi:hypothetical protein
MMSATLTGGCLCGAIRYESTGQPVLTVNCHCRDCQKASGGASTASLFVPIDSLKTTGNVKYYEKTGDSGQTISRGFCPNCGSALFGKPSIMPDLISIRPGTLDHPESFRPALDMYTSSALPWDQMDPALPKFETVPSGP